MQSLRFATFASLLSLVAVPAFAQPFLSAGGKITGAAFGGYQARTYQQHARDYSQMLYYEGRGEQAMSPQSSKQHVANIRKNVEASSKALDKIKEAHATKPEVAKAIDKIKDRHAKVTAKCNELDQHVAKADKDTTMLCDCCIEVMQELDAAVAETDKLLNDLKIKDVPKPAKSADKTGKDAPAKK